MFSSLTRIKPSEGQIVFKSKLTFSYRRSSFFLCLIVLFCTCVYSSENQAVFGLFKSYEVQLSPEVKGRITNQGEALAGVEVIRKLFYEGYEKNPVIDYALTNTRGEFSFDELIVRSKAPGNIVGQDYLIRQEITVKKDLINVKNEANDDGYYWLWVMSKGWKSVPPVSRLLTGLNADLQNEEVQYDLDISQYGGSRYQPLVTICDLDMDTINNLLSPE